MFDFWKISNVPKNVAVKMLIYEARRKTSDVTGKAAGYTANRIMNYYTACDFTAHTVAYIFQMFILKAYYFVIFGDFIVVHKSSNVIYFNQNKINKVLFHY